LRHRIKDQTVANVHLAEEANVYIEDDIIVVVRPNIPVSA
jgi:dihydropyrimidinase